MELMHVNGSEKEATAGEKSETRDLLNAYLKDAVSLTQGKTKKEAKQILEDYFEKADTEALMKAPDALDAVKAEEKDLKGKVADANLKTKINYATDANQTDTTHHNAGGGLAFVLSTLYIPTMTHDPSSTAKAIFAVTAGYAALRIVQNSKKLVADIAKSRTAEERISARDYADAKHAQLALKMLKKELEAPVKAAEKAKRKEEVAQLFAAGYGQPSGGLIQAATLKNQKAGR
ncbi:MAG: hypothetical protein J5716_07430 [Alphaproteobacteria bacterium]|nr:hypothetical protein [Alphaproteobacteria bacterium]